MSIDELILEAAGVSSSADVQFCNILLRPITIATTNSNDVGKNSSIIEIEDRTFMKVTALNKTDNKLLLYLDI